MLGNYVLYFPAYNSKQKHRDEGGMHSAHNLIFYECAMYEFRLIMTETGY